MAHRHQPLYRVVRAGWPDPLDANHAMARGGRWNAPSTFPVLYACCSSAVAAAIARERLEDAGLVLDDLRPTARPQLVELSWSGRVVDLTSAQGLATAGLPADYPAGVSHGRTRPLGSTWRAQRRAGVACRSATLQRRGVSAWDGPHERFSEVAIFVEHAGGPKLLRRVDGLDWLG
jgi:RES domain-containing protein